VCQSANRKSANFSDESANVQISTNTAQLCRKTAFYDILYFKGEKVCIFGFFCSFKSVNNKKAGSANRKSAKCAEDPQIKII
jgi:hypothetical protein